jgi:hypothetical protein
MIRKCTGFLLAVVLAVGGVVGLAASASADEGAAPATATGYGSDFVPWEWQ